MPKVGEPRLMPKGFGEPWAAADVELYRLAVLWRVLREHVPDTGNKLEDVFVGKVLMVMFTGDRDVLLEDTEREQRGLPLSGQPAVEMMVAVSRKDYLLNPDDAVGISERDLYVLARGHCPEGLGDDTVYVPRIPRDAAEADAMLGMFTLFTDATKPVADPKDAMRLYAGYTEAELLRDKGVGVVVR
jgi:hypothetical protein